MGTVKGRTFNFYLMSPCPTLPSALKHCMAGALWSAGVQLCIVTFQLPSCESLFLSRSLLVFSCIRLTARLPQGACENHRLCYS